MTYKPGHSAYKGYSFKRCIYSQWYWDNFLSQGYKGNSTNPNVTSITIAKVTEHTETEGTMNYHNRGGCPGWVCLDDNCWYYQTYGKRYFES